MSLVSLTKKLVTYSACPKKVNHIKLMNNAKNSKPQEIIKHLSCRIWVAIVLPASILLVSGFIIKMNLSLRN